MITGRTDNSRLAELKKYAVGVPFKQQYVSGGTWTTDGVDYGVSIVIENVTYYIGGIKYNDITLIDGTYTTFSYTPLSGGTSVVYYLGTVRTSGGTIIEYTPSWTTSRDFVDVPYYKNVNKEKIISNPKIYDDVFIVRDKQTAFDKNYRLEYINNLIELTTYAGGRFFNIINNT